jgi:TolA-binding protein
MKGRTVVEGTRRLIRVGWSSAGALALTLGVAGCATQADLLQQERKLSGMIEQQSRSLDALKNEIGAMREQRGPGAPVRPPIARGPLRPKDKQKVMETPLPSGAAPLPPNEPIGETPAPESREDARPSAAPSEALAAVPPAAAAATPPPAAEPAPADGAPAAGAPGAVDEDWRREVAQDRAVASATGAPERSQYVKSLEGLEKGDCSKAIPGLKAVSANSKGSPLSDNAMYWQARCLAARGDDRKAVARLKEVSDRYPKSDKAPAALWEQGQLQLRSGNSSAARGTFARLIKDYPGSAEAGRARRKLTELPN